MEQDVTLDVADIQGTVLRRRPPNHKGAYLLFRVDMADQARASLRQALPQVTSAAAWEEPTPFTLNIVFTWHGLRALGLPAGELDSFPEAFRMGMAARKQILGDHGASDPAVWLPPLGTDAVHIGVIVASSSEATVREQAGIARTLPGLTCIYELAVGVPPTGREHFGFRDGIGSPFVIGSGATALPGQDAIMPGEFVLGYPDESGTPPPPSGPDWLTRNGSFLAFRQMHADVASFRRYLRANARAAGDEELLAAKVVGRWRSGAPLMLAPEQDDPALAEDSLRNNDFRYAADPKGLLCPLGSHIRRTNPRDGLADSIVDVNIHRILRRGAAYGPVLPEGVMEDDGAERGIVFVFVGASLTRQFEFVQQAWINNGDFADLGTEKDPLVGNNDGTSGYTIPARPIRRHLGGLPGFTQVRGGEYCLLPGLQALRRLAQGG